MKAAAQIVLFAAGFISVCVAAPLLAPRQAATSRVVAMSTSPTTNRVDYLLATRTVGTVIYRYHGTTWASNVFSFVDITNQPAAPKTQIAVSWTAPMTLLSSPDLTTWTNLNASAVTTVKLPISGARAQFFKVPLANQSVSLTWDASPDLTVTGYVIYRGTNTGNYFVRTDVGAVTNYLAPGLIPGTVYYFVATARNNDGLESDYSNEVAYGAPVVEVQPVAVATP